MAVPTSSASGSTATGNGKKYTYRELQDLVTGVCVRVTNVGTVRLTVVKASKVLYAVDKGLHEG